MGFKFGILALFLFQTLSVASPEFLFPYSKSFDTPHGVTWLHLNGMPKKRRYHIKPGEGRSCLLEMSIDTCKVNPCKGETNRNLRLSYLDPEMTEDKGVIRQYLELDLKGDINPFKPQADWVSVSSSGHNITQVSYDPKNYTTYFFQERKYMIYNYTWAKVVTDESYQNVLSISVSRDMNPQTPEADRWTVLHCE